MPNVTQEMRESFPEEKGIPDRGRSKTKGCEMGTTKIHSRIGEKDGGWSRRGRREARTGARAQAAGATWGLWAMVRHSGGLPRI